MKIGRVIPLWALFLMLSSVIAFAKAEGKWESTKNSCNCNAFLIITRWEDGSPIGTMTCAGAQSAMYNLLVDGDHVLFSVDRRDNYQTVTYDYDVTVSGDSMIGTCTNEEVQSETSVFSAKRRTD
jgi:hypothetical protein